MTEEEKKQVLADMRKLHRQAETWSMDRLVEEWGMPAETIRSWLMKDPGLLAQILGVGQYTGHIPQGQKLPVPVAEEEA
jgi:hypothetical protein